MSVIVNAVIDHARIEIERGFILTCWLNLDYGGGSGQGFGGYSLFLGKTSKNYEQSLKMNYAGVFIYRLMEIAGVERFEDLKGKTIRVRKTDEWGSILAIGHIVKDDWFDPSVELKWKEGTV